MARKSSTARAAEDRELDLEYSERAGFLTGKAAAIAEWRHRKEREDGDRLIATVRATKWNREHPERRRANASAWWRRNAETAKAAQRARENAKQPKVTPCVVCGGAVQHEWPRPRGGQKRYCGDGCRRKAARAYQERVRVAKGLPIHVRRCSLCGEAGHKRTGCDLASHASGARR